LTSLLLSACEEVLHKHGLHAFAIEPSSQIFEGSSFPEPDLTPEIAQAWQKRIDSVFSSNVEQLVKATKDGIKVDPQAVELDLEAALEAVEARLAKKLSSYDAKKTNDDINKYATSAGEGTIERARAVGLKPVSTAEEFAIAEGLKAAYLSYRAAELSAEVDWDRIATKTGLSTEQRNVLTPFNPQFGRCLFAAKAVANGMDSVRKTLRDAFEHRQSEPSGIPTELIPEVKRLLNLPVTTDWQGFAELEAYTEANPRQRCSLGATSTEVEELSSSKMPAGTKVQAFSNRLPGGMSTEPKNA